MNNQQQQELNFIDAVSLLSFFMGLANLDANLTQNDKQEMLEDFNQKIKTALNEIHTHLENQDRKIDEIYYLLTQIYKNQKGEVKNVQDTYY